MTNSERPTKRAKIAPSSISRSFRYAINGVFLLFRGEHNMWVDLVATFVLMALCFAFKVSTIEFLFVVYAISIVFITEALNTSIEYLVDLVSPEYHPLAGKVKDIAAAAVLMAFMNSLIIGVVIFLPKVLELL